jgi:hypothetical protein
MCNMTMRRLDCGIESLVDESCLCNAAFCNILVTMDVLTTGFFIPLLPIYGRSEHPVLHSRRNCYADSRIPKRITSDT